MTSPLHSYHTTYGARFTDFAGWKMPLEFSSIKTEVHSVRNSCGLFDLSHMGRLVVKGQADRLDFLTSRSIENLKVGRVQYNLIMNEKGGVKDDITLYKLSEDNFFLCVNAANRVKVVQWLSVHDIEVEDKSQDMVQFALQGPRAVEVLEEHLPVRDLKYYTFRLFDSLIISRTGYTGEDGFEVYAPVEKGIELFQMLAKKCTPCGLGARDVLRVEAGMPLYGHELSEDISPFEAGLDRYVDLQKEFIGKDSLLKRKVDKKLFGLELFSRGVPREGYTVFHKDQPIGLVSSGTFSPTLQKGIALCFVKLEYREAGLPVELQVRDKKLPALLRNYPFFSKR